MVLGLPRFNFPHLVCHAAGFYQFTGTASTVSLYAPGTVSRIGLHSRFEFCFPGASGANSISRMFEDAQEFMMKVIDPPSGSRPVWLGTAFLHQRGAPDLAFSFGFLSSR